MSYEEETNWIEFEIWIDDVGVQGYMAEDEANDEKPLNYYSWDGFECRDLSRTKYPYFTESKLFRWEILVDWIKTSNIAPILAKFANEKKVCHFKAESDWGRRFDVELHINCSKKFIGDV